MEDHYLVEFAIVDKRKESADESLKLKTYKAASNVTVTESPSTHAVHLGLASTSVFLSGPIRNPHYSHSHTCNFAKRHLTLIV